MNGTGVEGMRESSGIHGWGQCDLRSTYCQLVGVIRNDERTVFHYTALSSWPVARFPLLYRLWEPRRHVNSKLN